MAEQVKYLDYAGLVTLVNKIKAGDAAAVKAAKDYVGAIPADATQTTVIDYLMDCPVIRDNPLFFNFAEIEDNNKQIVTTATDKRIEQPYIDGSVLKRYTFTIIDYRSVIYDAIVPIPGYDNENVQDMLDVQGIIDWIDEQNDNYNFPNFGEDCIVEEISTMTDSQILMVLIVK